MCYDINVIFKILFREQVECLKTTPLFQRATTNATQQYPYVFDEFATKKHSSAMVGGTKVGVKAIFHFSKYFHGQKV